MSTIKPKQKLISEINKIIEDQTDNRSNKNTFKLKKLAMSVNNFEYLDSKEKKLISDTIRVLLDFYSENSDKTKNPNKLPDNFFTKILEDVSSTDSDIKLSKSSIKSEKSSENTKQDNTSELAENTEQGDTDNEAAENTEQGDTDNEAAENTEQDNTSELAENRDIDENGNINDDLQTIIDENYNEAKYIPNKDIEKILEDFSKKTQNITSSVQKLEREFSDLKSTTNKKIDEIEEDVDKITVDVDEISDVANEIENDIKKANNDLGDIKSEMDLLSSNSENNSVTTPDNSQTNVESPREVQAVKKILEKHMQLSIDNLFKDIDKSEISHLKQSFSDKVAIYMNGLLDNTIQEVNDFPENKESKERILKLIIKYNTGILDFLEHKLSLE